MPSLARKPTVQGRRIYSFILVNGERYCALVNRVTNAPIFYPLLYVTTKIRCASQSLAVMEQAFAAINVLLTFCDERCIDLPSRLLRKHYLDAGELDALRDFCQRNFAHSASSKSTNVSSLSSSKRRRKTTVGLPNRYTRLTHIANYLKWLSEHLLVAPIASETSTAIETMYIGIKARRPNHKGRNETNHVRGLTEEQLFYLEDVTSPASSLNPFKGISIKKRNQLIVRMLRYLGPRGGELLNVRIRDIDWTLNQIVIARRADEAADPRRRQPLVKTLDRRLPMKDTLVEALHEYIVEYRKKVPNARKHDYLFVTHKAGPTQGWPLSRSSYMKIMKQIANSCVVLHSFTGHAPRYAWNHEFSKLMEEKVASGKLTERQAEAQEVERSYLQGWHRDSNTGQTYNRRFVEEKARAKGLELQQGMARTPRGLQNE